MAGRRSEDALDAWMPRLARFARLGRGLDLPRVGRAVRALSLGLTRERRLAGEGYLDRPDSLAAYLLFYWPISYAQVRALLPELPAPRRVLDFGGGAGPAAFACLDAGAGEARLVDRSRPALDAARALAREVASPLSVERRTVPGPLPDGSFDLIVVQHLVNELWAGEPDALVRRVALARSLLSRLSPGGTLLLVDPALRETSRDLLVLRDALVAGGAAVRAPCLFRGPCPALARPADWCHAERPWEPPRLVAEIARAAGLHKEALKMCAVAFASPGEPWPEAPAGRVLRIVSEPLSGKGRRRYVGCGPEGRFGLSLQDKHVGPGNALFGQLARGDVIRASGLTARGDGLRIEADSVVVRLARAGEPAPSAPHPRRGAEGERPRSPGGASRSPGP